MGGQIKLECGLVEDKIMGHEILLRSRGAFSSMSLFLFSCVVTIWVKGGDKLWAGPLGDFTSALQVPSKE
jgi:hypothetical protein